MKIKYFSINTTVTWAEVADATEYDVYLGKEGTVAETATKYNNSVVEEGYYTIISLILNKIYYIWIKAKNVLGASDLTITPECTDSPDKNDSMGYLYRKDLK